MENPFVWLITQGPETFHRWQDSGDRAFGVAQAVVNIIDSIRNANPAFSGVPTAFSLTPKREAVSCKSLAVGLPIIAVELWQGADEKKANGVALSATYQVRPPYGGVSKSLNERLWPEGSRFYSRCRRILASGKVQID